MLRRYRGPGLSTSAQLGHGGSKGLEKSFDQEQDAEKDESPDRVFSSMLSTPFLGTFDGDWGLRGRHLESDKRYLDKQQLNDIEQDDKQYGDRRSVMELADVTEGGDVGGSG
jgi:hypothetical protein